MAPQPQDSEPKPKSLRDMLIEEDGQAMTEYIIMVVFMVLALAAVFGVFPRVMGDYFFELSRILTFPIP